MQELKADFSLKESDQLTVFAVVGCSLNADEGFKKLAQFANSTLEMSNEVVNMVVFEQAVPRVIEMIRKEKEQSLRDMAQQHKLKKQTISTDKDNDDDQ